MWNYTRCRCLLENLARCDGRQESCREETCLVWQGRAGTLPALSKPRVQKHLHGSQDIQIYPLRDFTGFFQHALPCLTGPFWQKCPQIRSRSFWAKSGDDGVRLCRGDVWPLWAPGPCVLLPLACHGCSLSLPGWGIGGVFPFLRKWPDQCSTQTHPLARSFPPIGHLSKHTWVSGGLHGKKRVFLEHEGSADKWKGTGQRIPIYTIEIISRNKNHLLLEPHMV